MKVVVAMSGGVDSTVAAALLKEEGNEVIGVTMQLWEPAGKDDSGRRRPDAVENGREAARTLGITHHVTDFRDIFARLVVDDFCREYSLGRTPNPCVRCNRLLKFGALLERSAVLGADFIATGHYARVESTGGRFLLKKGADVRKDQSYFLYALTQEQLKHALFPLGHLTKDKVRRIAVELGLSAASRPESREICFIPDNDHAGFINGYLAGVSRPGPILDEKGNVLGNHGGIASYTIGQRHGLGVAAARPLYVTAIAPDENAVIVGGKERTYGRGLVATGLNWIAIEKPEHPIEVKARIRYRHPEAEAVVTPLENGDVRVEFAGPQMAVTPGQAVVFYRGDSVIGGGTILK
jgi:tRNA-specific 2-thiouridylase